MSYMLEQVQVLKRILNESRNPDDRALAAVLLMVNEKVDAVIEELKLQKWQKGPFVVRGLLDYEASKDDPQNPVGWGTYVKPGIWAGDTAPEDPLQPRAVD